MDREQAASKLDLSSPQGRSNGMLAAWLESWAEYLGRLEEEHDPAHVVSVEEIITPGSVVLFALSCTGLLGVGFRIGHLREVRKDKHGEVPGSFRDRLFKRLGIVSQNHSVAPADPTGLSLRERVNLKTKQAQKQARPLDQGTASSASMKPKPVVAPITSAQASASNRATLLKRRPAAAPAELAFKALGYATVITVSTAGLAAVCAKWYFQIGDMEDLVWRLKHNVPHGADRIRGVIGAPLEGLRDSMQYLFRPLRPAIAPKGSIDGDIYSQVEDEKAELRSLGINPEGLFDHPKQPHIVGEQKS